MKKEYVESLLKQHAAYLLATIDNKGTHIGKFNGIALDADGDWIIEADVESLSATDRGDFSMVVHGEWVEREIAKATYLSCSRCGWARIGVAVTEHYRYCPNCGAKMDGGKNVEST